MRLLSTHTPTAPAAAVSISTLANVLSALLAAIRSWTKCLLVCALPLRSAQLNELPPKDELGAWHPAAKGVPPRAGE